MTYEKSNNWTDFPELKKDMEWETGSGLNGECFISKDDSIHFQIRLNDFPEEPCYTLMMDDKEILHFDDWPDSWKRPEFPDMK